MPELPDVEWCRQLVQRALVGRRIAAVAVSPDPIVFERVAPRRLIEALRGRQVLAARRKGKHLWLELDRRPWPVFHLGMSGWFHAYREEGARPRFWKLEVVADRGGRVCMTDVRRFGRIRLRRDPPGEPPLSELGFDAMHELPAPRELARILGRRQAPIKAVLLDQSVFAGVGNWIADEVLYQAAIRPQRPASSLALGEVRRLRSRLHAILVRAVAVGADGDRFPRSWLFHYRWGRKADARTAAGERIVHDTVGGRTTAWAPSRQR